MNLEATQSLEAAPAPSARFAYATGDRPLAGFTIKRGIGRGGFGEVYYALSDAGKEVALKLVCRNLDVELRGVTQCLNLKHPNLLSLYDIRQDDSDQSWIVMEYIVGDSLEKVLAAHPQGMPIEDAIFWMQGMAAGVAYLHDHGIVHRDLKPGNVFCDEGIVKIGDYGLSKFMSCSRRSGQTGSIGTVHYMAPEVANGRYGKEIDIYALGVVFYEMITGRVPFEGESLGEVLMKHLTADPDLTKIAEPYRTAIARALLKDPEARLHSVAELMSLLPRPTQAMMGGNRPVPLPAPLVVDAGSPGARCRFRIGRRLALRRGSDSRVRQSGFGAAQARRAGLASVPNSIWRSARLVVEDTAGRLATGADLGAGRVRFGAHRRAVGPRVNHFRRVLRRLSRRLGDHEPLSSSRCSDADARPARVPTRRWKALPGAAGVVSVRRKARHCSARGSD